MINPFKIEITTQYRDITSLLYTNIETNQMFKIINDNKEDVEVVISTEDEDISNIEGIKIYGTKSFNDIQKNSSRSESPSFLLDLYKKYYIKAEKDVDVKILKEDKFDKDEVKPTPQSYPTTQGALVSVLANENPTVLAVFRSKENHSTESALQLFNFLPFTGEGLITTQMIGGITLEGVEGVDYNFVDIGFGSQLEVSTDVTAISNGKVATTKYFFPVSGQGNQMDSFSPSVEDAEKLGLSMKAGEVFAIVAQIASEDGVSIAWSVNWGEI